MGLTAVFTYLKIILLQYFQFLVFNKISGIQTHHKILKTSQFKNDYIRRIGFGLSPVLF